MKIKDMPTSLQPRERLLKYGVENISDIDLLSIILRTGTKDTNVKEVASNILNKIGSINNLSNIGIRELSNIKGVGTVKAISILASIELGFRVLNKEIELNEPLKNAYIVHETFKKLFINEKQEKLLAIFLDTKKRLISYKIIFIGTLDKSLIHPREIFSEAIKNHASSFIIMHNHPSNEIIPSSEDINITNNIKEASLLLNIPLNDHIITNGKEYYSFHDNYYKE